MWSSSESYAHQRKRWLDCISYIRSSVNVRDVTISGGDASMLSGQYVSEARRAVGVIEETEADKGKSCLYIRAGNTRVLGPHDHSHGTDLRTDPLECQQKSSNT